MNEGSGLMLLAIAPGVVGIVCLGVAIALFSNAKTADGRTRTIYVVLGVILMIAALGIGSCYGVFFLN